MRIEAIRDALLAAEVVCSHTDADGLGAAAQVLRARGEGADAALILAPGETPWGPRTRLPGGLVAILDQGVRAIDGPVVVVDHHAPETTLEGEGQLVLSGFEEGEGACTATLVRRVLPEQPAWLAALGAFGDLGAPGLALPEAAGAARTAVRKLTPLVNAPRRIHGGPVRTALALLVEHDDPKQALADPRIAELEEAKGEARAAFERAVKTAPQVGPEVAIIRFDEPAQVHPLVATTWARRMGPRVVLAANAGWLPGRVNFAVRGGEGDLRTWLREALPEGDGHEFAHGHPRATGGSLPPELFALLAGRLLTPGG